MSDRISTILSRLSDSTHRAGTLGIDVLLAIESILPDGPIRSVETGCGKSTIMLSNLSREHLVFAYDDRHLADSSVTMVMESPDFVKRNTAFVFGPTQKTLPAYNFRGRVFDVALIDGPHGFPFPDLEYAMLYDKLRQGSILIIDDIHIPSIGHLYDQLRADRMYDEVGVFASTGVLRRTAATGVPVDGDHWYEQAYNFSQFPRSMEKYHGDQALLAGQSVEFTTPDAVGRFARRGFEFDQQSRSARVIDLTATLEIATDLVSSVAELEIVYRSGEQEAGAATLSDGAETVLLPYHAGFLSRRFTVRTDLPGRIRLEIGNSGALPEHDLGHERNNFRRLGPAIRSIALKERPASALSSRPERRLSRQARERKPVRPPSADRYLEVLERHSSQFPYAASPTVQESVSIEHYLVPRPGSFVRFLPLKPSWFLQELVGFDGEDFVYAATRSLRHRAPTDFELRTYTSPAKSSGKVEFLLMLDDESRREGSGARLVRVGASRFLWRIHTLFARLRLKPIATLAHKMFRAAARRDLRSVLPDALSRQLAYSCLDRIDRLRESIA